MAHTPDPGTRLAVESITPLCQSKKCPVERRPYPPGEHGRSRIRERLPIQLAEADSATVRGARRQFRRYYEEAERRPGITGDNLQILEEPSRQRGVAGPAWPEPAPRLASSSTTAIPGQRQEGRHPPTW